MKLPFEQAARIAMEDAPVKTAVIEYYFWRSDVNASQLEELDDGSWDCVEINRIYCPECWDIALDMAWMTGFLVSPDVLPEHVHVFKEMNTHERMTLLDMELVLSSTMPHCHECIYCEKPVYFIK